MGRTQITNGDKADATLTGEISRITRAPARSVRGNVLATTEFSLWLVVKILADRTGWQTTGAAERRDRNNQLLCKQRRD